MSQHQLLLRLFWMRCVTTLAQALLVASAIYGMELSLPLAPLCTVLGLMLVFNGLTWLRMRLPQPVREPELFFQLCIDVSALSALLYFTGGATNPFVSFYLPALAVAAAVLPSAYAFGLALYSLACYSALTYLYQPLHIHDHDQAMAYHLAGMWVNFVMSAALITWFVTRMSATVRSRDAQLAQAREQQLQDERIVALGTQAASAAHEMSTPLATVAVIAGELRIEAGRNNALTMYRDDLAVVEEQIAVCKTALDRMGMDVQVRQTDTAAPVSLSDWLRHFVDSWRLRHPAVSIRLTLPQAAPDLLDTAPALIGQVVQTLLDNAAQAVAENGKVDVVLSLQKDAVASSTMNSAIIRVADDGPGIAPELLKRLGYEPVRSSTGGKGIGLMLAFATARQMGGKLTLAAATGTAGRGACATLALPLISPNRLLLNQKKT
ncbi:HAMP domain-containing histidine kinase [Herbaspirillum sp. 3R11]|nr:sensor histidine kinase [Herbaspirillum sp. 3R-3a1]TFI11560.1 HAMP domain-containing histidine kinase [Herbaspirillum sp. 3R11]TFI17463.1 HAMP domain-containing histidine kinase [Herbaspirillum sp. 3R-11]TFI28464.1 HAMP domain-containing histidine kinase [Herbaspirillum sp. 3C11]